MAKNCHEWTWPQVHYFGQNLENWTDNYHVINAFSNKFNV